MRKSRKNMMNAAKRGLDEGREKQRVRMWCFAVLHFIANLINHDSWSRMRLS
jgi:hypothetical protein